MGPDARDVDGFKQGLGIDGCMDGYALSYFVDDRARFAIDGIARLMIKCLHEMNLYHYCRCHVPDCTIISQILVTRGCWLTCLPYLFPRNRV